MRLGRSLLTQRRRHDLPVRLRRPLDRIELQSRGPYLLTWLINTSSSSAFHGPFLISSFLASIFLISMISLSVSHFGLFLILSFSLCAEVSLGFVVTVGCGYHPHYHYPPLSVPHSPSFSHTHFEFADFTKLPSCPILSPNQASPFKAPYFPSLI